MEIPGWKRHIINQMGLFVITDLAELIALYVPGFDIVFPPITTYKTSYFTVFDKKEGVEFVQYPGGDTMATQYDNGIRHGTEILRFPNGIVRRCTHYVHNKKHGIQHIFFPSGTLGIFETWKHDQRHGVGFRWDSSGRIVSSETFVDGHFHGEQFSWFENGGLRYCSMYRNGLRDGIDSNWTFDGKLIKQTLMQDWNIVREWYDGRHRESLMLADPMQAIESGFKRFQLSLRCSKKQHNSISI